MKNHVLVTAMEPLESSATVERNALHTKILPKAPLQLYFFAACGRFFVA
jgi:hypothetical protein